MANVLLVVDMLVGFMEPDHNLYCGDDARKIIPNVQRLIKEEQAKGSLARRPELYGDIIGKENDSSTEPVWMKKP